MGRRKKMLINTFLLTGTSLLMRSTGMVFQVYLSRLIGAAGIGLFQLIMSVSTLAATIAISGIRFASTRIISEELGKGNHGGIKVAVARCCGYSLFFGVGVCAALFFSAPFIGERLIGDVRAVLSLRMLAVSLPFLALGSVFGGYFTAVSRVAKSSVVAVLEQFVRI
ncbi:MAG: oligosaccharide flippase family protein, partial [Oscillospiraceae bacterium]|nr:oligosaccharide flippase family protein [Oscillospiraceae bacterium]